MNLFVGVDVSKRCLDVYLNEKEQYLSYSNDKQGIKKLISLLKKKAVSLELVLCEASGGYEQLLVKSLHGNSLPIHVAHANKIRAFAKAKGWLAKTDKIDARTISVYGQQFKPTPDEVLLNEEEEELGNLLKRREQLCEERQREKNRLDKICSAAISKSINSHVKWLDKEIKKLEQIIKQLQKTDSLKKKITLLTSVPAIGDLVASYLLAFLPELGQLDCKQIAALVGLAPFNKDSGKYSGKRFIQGGRSKIRRMLYMAAIASVRCYLDMQKFYARLRAAGKPTKVALVAVARKLLTVANSVMSRQTSWELIMPKK